MQISQTSSLLVYSPYNSSSKSYPPNLNCTLQLFNNNSANILIEIVYLIVEYSVGCIHRDFLSINLDNQTIPKYYCGNINVEYLTTNFSVIEFRFRSDSVVETTGFLLNINLLKHLQQSNDLCENLFITNNRILISSNKIMGDIIECSGTILSKSKIGIIFEIRKMNLKKQYHTCNEEYIKLEYYDYFLKKRVEKYICGLIKMNGPILIAYSAEIKLSTKFQMNGELIIDYRSIYFPENVYLIQSEEHFLELTKLSESLSISFNNKSIFAVDISNKLCLFAFKIRSPIGMGIILNFSKFDENQFKIFFTEYFLNQINFLTIRQMKLLNKNIWSTKSFQITLVIQYFNCDIDYNEFNLMMFIKSTNLSIKENFINTKILTNQWFQLINENNNRVIQISNYVNPPKHDLTFFYLKINRLTSSNSFQQDYSCNQTGLYIYDNSSVLFGPFCHTTDFMPIEKLPITVVYYYYPIDESSIDASESDTFLEIFLEFYPCEISTLQSSNFIKFKKCLIFYQPLITEPLNTTKNVILIRSNENINLFKLHTRLDMEFKENIINLDKPLTLSSFQSHQCYFGFIISQNPMTIDNFIVLLEINTNCSFIPTNWSIHLELASRQRIHCNSVNNILSGLMSLDSKFLSNDIGNLDFVMPICTWNFKKPNMTSLPNSINMLLLEIDVLNLNCEKYIFQMFESIGDTIHKLNLCDGVKHGDKIFSRSDGDIYITLKPNYLSKRRTVLPSYQFDEIFIFFKYVSMNYEPNQLKCENGWWAFEKNCYKFEKALNEISWNSSNSVCQSYDAKLVKIGSKEEMEFLRKLSATVWLLEIYSNTGIVIFIGLKTQMSVNNQSHIEDFYHLTWLNDEPLIYHEWFQRSSSKIYSYLSSSLKGLVNSILQQPSVEDNGHLCTAMMMQHPFYWSNWVKIPCESKIHQAAFICQKSSTNSKLLNYNFKKEISKINDIHGLRCHENWFLIDKYCLMLVKVNDTKIEKSLFCKLKNSKLATFTNNEAVRIATKLRQLLTINMHNSLYYQDGLDVKIIPSVLIIPQSVQEQNGFVICQRPSQTLLDLRNKSIMPSNIYWCGDTDSYWIGLDKRCDNHIDCLDSKMDEKDCPVKETLKSLESHQNFFDCNSDPHHYISWNKYCNFIEDCENGNDEKLCSHSRCMEITEWQCKNKQCIESSKRCDKIIDCFDKSDEKDCENKICNGFKCTSSVCLPSMFKMDDIVDCPGSLMEDENLSKVDCFENPSEIKSPCSLTSNKCFQINNTCIYRQDNLLSRDSCPLLEHVQNCNLFQCPGMFQCHKIKYCIDMYHLCDGIKDCPDGEDEDEENCKSLRCPFNFRCWSLDRTKLLCINQKDVCNGIKYCPFGEDEQYCDISHCPDHCTCLGYSINCDSSLSVNISNLNSKTRTLTIVKTRFLELNSGIFSSFIYLGYLNLSKNSILELYTNLFDGLFNLKYLIISKNFIRTIPSYIFQFLNQLLILDLTDNPIKTIESYAFHNLLSLSKIQLSSMQFQDIRDYTFLGMSENLVNIDMSNNDIKSISQFAFIGINNLSTLAISVNKNDIAMYGEPLKHLTVINVSTNVYKICCSLASYKRCSAKSDVSSNCEDLLANKSIQVIVWSMGIIGLIGNITVILWRILDARNGKFSTEDLLIVNLAISDMFMGIYLIIIASADKYYRSQYIENSVFWKSSLSCLVAGYFATVSNQASVTFIGLITLDRFVCIIFSLYKHYTSKIKYLVIFVWFGWMLALALFQYYFNSKIEGCESSGLCLSYFSFRYECTFKQNLSIILLSYILVFLVLIVTGYVIIFIHSCRTRRTSGRTLMLNDYKSAKKMLSLILPSFLCWFPIIILSFLSRYGNYEMENDQLTWLTVVLMPINSSLNPYLYTFSNVNLFFKSKINPSKMMNYAMQTKH